MSRKSNKEFCHDQNSKKRKLIKQGIKHEKKNPPKIENSIFIARLFIFLSSAKSDFLFFLQMGLLHFDRRSAFSMRPNNTKQ